MSQPDQPYTANTLLGALSDDDLALAATEEDDTLGAPLTGIGTGPAGERHGVGDAPGL